MESNSRTSLDEIGIARHEEESGDRIAEMEDPTGPSTDATVDAATRIDAPELVIATPAEYPGEYPDGYPDERFEGYSAVSGVLTDAPFDVVDGIAGLARPDVPAIVESLDGRYFRESIERPFVSELPR